MSQKVVLVFPTTVVLDAQPAANVTVTVNVVGAGGAVTVDDEDLVFELHLLGSRTDC